MTLTLSLTGMENEQNKKVKAKEFLAKNILAFLICLIFAGLAFFSVSGFNFKNLKYSGDSITSDEVPHITSGYYYLKSGRYFLNPEHPPLAKDISALPLLILNPDFPKVSMDAPYPPEAEKEDLFFNKKIFPRDLEIENYHWDNRMLIFNPRNNPDLIIMLARFSVIIANSFFLFLFYLTAKKLWSKRAALISLAIIAFSPLSIAHASLVTTDFMGGILSMTAVGAFAIFIKKDSILENHFNKTGFAKKLIIASVFLSLAFLSKFSSIILIPSLLAGGLLYSIVFLKNGKKIRTNAFLFLGKYAAVIFLSLTFVLFFYSFHVKNSDSGGIKSQLSDNYSKKLPESGKAFVFKMAEGNRFQKALASYVIGLSMTLNRIDSAGQSTYFLGKIYHSEGAGLFYFPVLAATKISPSTIFLFLLIFFMASKKIARNLTNNFLEKTKIIDSGIVLFVFFALFYGKNALTSNLNIGVRHFLPVIFAAMILTARIADLYWDKIILKFKTKYFVLGSVFLAGISTLLSFPHYLPYYNIFVGGTNNGYKIATDSNYDWGQDIKRLSAWMDDNGVEKIYTHLFSANKLDYYLKKHQWFDIKNDDLPPPDSYIAVSTMEYQNNVYDENLPDNKKYTSLGKPIARAGKSIFIFKVK